MSPIADLRTLFGYRMTDEQGCVLAITLAQEDDHEAPRESGCSVVDAPQLLRHLVTRLAAEAGLVALVHPRRFEFRGTFVEFFWVCAVQHLSRYTAMADPVGALKNQ